VICVPAWLPLYVSSAFGTSAAETSASLAPIGLGVAIGAWTGGFLSIRFGWRSIVITGLLVSGLLVALIVLLSGSSATISVAILACWIGMFFAAPVQSLFPFVIAQEWTALAAAYYNSIGFVGAFLASLAFGVVVDWFSDFTVGWLFFSVIPILGIVAAVSLPIPGRANSTPSL
jgi:predicted MFS family arabinose efflux permease